MNKMKSIQSVLGSFLLVLLTLCNLPSVHANPAEATKATLASTGFDKDIDAA